MNTFDTTILYYLNIMSVANHTIRLLVIFFADYSQYVLAGLLIIYAFKKQIYIKTRVQIAIIALLSGLFARIAIKPLIVSVWQRPRPYVAFSDIHALITPVTNEALQSFPSGHAIFFFAVSTVLYRYEKRLSVIFFGTSIVMGVSRVAVGVHYPTDIIAGCILGVLTGCLFIYITERILKKYTTILS